MADKLDVVCVDNSLAKECFIQFQLRAEDSMIIVAKLWIEDGEMKFEGNMCLAARAMFEQELKPLCDQYLENHAKTSRPE